jgi:hypothetical protein
MKVMISFYFTVIIYGSNAEKYKFNYLLLY